MKFHTFKIGSSSGKKNQKFVRLSCHVPMSLPGSYACFQPPFIHVIILRTDAGLISATATAIQGSKATFC